MKYIVERRKRRRKGYCRQGEEEREEKRGGVDTKEREKFMKRNWEKGGTGNKGGGREDAQDEIHARGINVSLDDRNCVHVGL